MDDYQRKRYYRERKLNREAFDERLRRRSERQRYATAVAAATIPPQRNITSAENLIRTYDMLKRQGGRGPGPDGVRYQDLGHREVCQIMRDVSKEILGGRYQPSRRRTVKVKKPTGGYRKLSLRSVVNRVIDRAVTDALTPYFEGVFLPGNHGFRPNLGTWTALLDLERAIAEQGHHVVTQDDIRKAFDFVPIRHVVELYRCHIGANPLVDLIERILQGHHSEGRTLGIDQGSSLSPLSLNVLLHHGLDAPFSECAANTHWIRYADNLLYLTQSEPEGLAALQQVTDLLRPYGLSLKGQDGPPRDLNKRGHKVRFLGFSIYMEEGKVRYGIPRRKWLELQEDLLESHKAKQPSEDTPERPRPQHKWTCARLDDDPQKPERSLIAW
jgi:retron-type reverse transcriptase